MGIRAVVAISLLVLVACDDTALSPSDVHSPSVGKRVVYQDAEILIHDLNELLRPSLRCDVDRPDLTTGYAERIPNEDAAACRFPNGASLFALIVRNGEETYKRYIGRSFGPNKYLRGINWIVIMPISAPSQALEELRVRLDTGG